LEDRRISAKSIAEQLGISRERVGSIILEDLDMRKATKGVLFLHDKAPAHRALATQKKLAYLGFHCLDHPPYSPDLAPSDYHLFLGLKKQLKGRHFSSDAEVIAAAET
jgi:transposase